MTSVVMAASSVSQKGLKAAEREDKKDRNIWSGVDCMFCETRELVWGGTILNLSVELQVGRSGDA